MPKVRVEHEMTEAAFASFSDGVESAHWQDAIAALFHRFYKRVFQQLKNMRLTAVIIAEDLSYELRVKATIECFGQTYTVERGSNYIYLLGLEAIDSWNWMEEADSVALRIVHKLAHDIFLPEVSQTMGESYYPCVITE